MRTLCTGLLLLLEISVNPADSFAAFPSQPGSPTSRSRPRQSSSALAFSREAQAQFRQSTSLNVRKPTTRTLQQRSRVATVSNTTSFSSLHVASLEDTSALYKEDSKDSQQDEELSLWAARGILLLVAAIWGTNFACVKYLNGLCFDPPCNHPPSEFAFARFGVAALVSLPLLTQQRRDVILGGFECGLWITMGYIAQSMALATISAGECAFICSLTVVFVPIVSLILYGKPLKVKDLVAGATAIAGVAVLEGMIDVQSLLGISPAVAAAQESAVPTVSAISSSSLDTAAVGPVAMVAKTLGVSTGDLLALGQPIGFGFAFTRIEHYQEQFKDVENRVLTIAAAQCLMVGVLSFFWVLYDYHGVLPDFGYMVEPHRLVTLAWTGIVTTLVAIFMEGIALQKASATDASIAFSSEPVWASLFGFLLLRETLGLDAYIGGSIIMTACLIGAVSDLKE